MYFRDLSFKKGDMIILRQKVDSNWYQGEANGVIGIFPLSYVQVSKFVLIFIILIQITFYKLQTFFKYL